MHCRGGALPPLPSYLRLPAWSLNLHHPIYLCACASPHAHMCVLGAPDHARAPQRHRCRCRCAPHSAASARDSLHRRFDPQVCVLPSPFPPPFAQPDPAPLHPRPSAGRRGAAPGGGLVPRGKPPPSLLARVCHLQVHRPGRSRARRFEVLAPAKTYSSAVKRAAWVGGEPAVLRHRMHRHDFTSIHRARNTFVCARSRGHMCAHDSSSAVACSALIPAARLWLCF
ncbi:MAG: hypothetical protein J3K34DRAFT_284098 [Monoraphidium minutum]|nr:MAG: hypothetical protein J3K34DRAFT_284098 [Monoraphidium minutum]